MVWIPSHIIRHNTGGNKIFREPRKMNQNGDVAKKGFMEITLKDG